MLLYLHIPFCRQACHYCDFHFSTALGQKTAMINAMAAELAFRSTDTPIETVYFGGGTPSLLSESELSTLFTALHKHFTLQPNTEITLEANPDDISRESLATWRSFGVNRLSIGIQTFHAPHLRWFNRIHGPEQAETAVRLAQNMGIENLSLDLIYGIPAPDHAILESDIAKIISFEAPHISAYCLTIEPKTVFGNWLKTKRILPIDDTFAAEQFTKTVATLAGAGYEQYEISNFARAGAYSRHNTGYWQGKPYLGIGPSAHSFDGHRKRWHNIAHNQKYISAMATGIPEVLVENLTEKDRYNDYLLTNLRTVWGLNINKLQDISEQGYQYFMGELPVVQAKNWVQIQDEMIRLTDTGKLFADAAAEALFWV